MKEAEVGISQLVKLAGAVQAPQAALRGGSSHVSKKAPTRLDRNIASSASGVVFKGLGIMQVDFDRPELRKLVTEARNQLSAVGADKRKWAYVYSPDTDFMGLLESELPTS